MGDDNVSKHLNKYPEITFRRSRSLCDSCVHTHYAFQSDSFNNAKGTRPCHRCNFCRHIYAASSIALTNRHLFRAKFLATCQLFGTVYLMICECHAFYIGKTKQPFFHRIRDHVSLVSKKLMQTPISRHMGLFHNFDCSKMHFFALEHISPGDRGGDYDKTILQLEGRWIHKLSALNYPGFNDAYSFKPFLWLFKLFLHHHSATLFSFSPCSFSFPLIFISFIFVFIYFNYWMIQFYSIS